MTKRILVCVWLLGLLLATLPAWVEAGGIDRVKKAGVLKVGSDITYPPFEVMEAGKPAGFDVEMAYTLADELGMAIEFAPVPRDRLAEVVNAGLCDVIWLASGGGSLGLLASH